MTPQEFFEHMKRLFENVQQGDDAPNTSVSSAPSNIVSSAPSNIKAIVRPKKQYIKTKEILSLFGFTKVEYNNILVRKQTFK